VIIGKSPVMESLRDTIANIAEADVDVLLIGETGTGKELAARALHDLSARKENRFVGLNCGAMPETIIENELFGHEAGAFTGAGKTRIGKIEHAQGGTLFLDEIETMSTHLQVKLLRVLQERVIVRLGGNEEIPVNMRVVAASKVDLREACEKGEFREDLYYRLNVAKIVLPPLRRRKEDITFLFQRFVAAACSRYQRSIPSLEPPHAVQLMSHDWPGNVRELKNVIERAVILSQGTVLRLDLSLADIGAKTVVGPQHDDLATESLILTEKDMKILQKKNLLAALRQTNWRVSGKGGAAELLGVRPTTLADRIKSFGVRKPHHS